MATDARTKSDAVVEEITATSPSRSSKVFDMPCLKNEHGKAFAGGYQEAMVSETRQEQHIPSARAAWRADL